MYTFIAETRNTPVVELDTESRANERMMRVLLQLGHLGAHGAIRLFKLATFASHRVKVADVTQPCSCRRAGISHQAPISNRNVSTPPWVYIGQLYPTPCDSFVSVVGAKGEMMGNLPSVE